MENCSFRREDAGSIAFESLEKIGGFEAKSSTTIGEVLRSYKKIGFQASQIGRAAELIKKMKKDGAAVFLSCTSNMVSSGLREIIALLVKEKLVTAIITSTGAIEEDVMKTMHSFALGDFEASDSEVKANALNRIGNIFVPDSQYCDFEDFHMRFIEKAHAQKRIISPSEYIALLGRELSDEKSILYWASRNSIPIFCPGFVDGAMGDHFFFFNEKKKDGEKLVIDTAADLTRFYKIMLDQKKTGGIILGGGIAKHHLIGAAILRNGLDYAIYITTGTQYDGSLSGAQPKEAVSWNKLKSIENSVCIECDATIAFPLLAAAWLEKL